MISWIYFFLALIITVCVHELGHMLVALWNKVSVKVFSLGFGKCLLHKKLWNIDFRLSLIPLGGYCRLEGEKDKIKTGWLTKRYSKKLAIVLAGITANLLLAFLCYWINYRSISLGLSIDLKLIQALLTKNYDNITNLITMPINFFILQLGFMNLFACITNILPFPALDGGYVWLFLLEKKFKNKFVPFLEKITKIGFVSLIILQIILIYWIWFV